MTGSDSITVTKLTGLTEDISTWLENVRWCIKHYGTGAIYNISLSQKLALETLGDTDVYSVYPVADVEAGDGSVRTDMIAIQAEYWDADEGYWYSGKIVLVEL